MRLLTIALMAALTLSACGGDKEDREATKRAAKPEAFAAATPAESVATLARNLPLAECLAEHGALATTETPGTCPTYILLALDSMVDECMRVGGALQPMDQPEAWVLETEDDDQPEILVDLTKNYICYGAPSVFACGSQGCPVFLYASRGEGWIEIGAINADDAPKIELLKTKGGGHKTLRGGCLGERPCSELTYYEWKNDHYERTWIDYRGNVVDVLPGELWTLTKDSAVRTAPDKKAPVIDEYPVGTAMVVIGSARSGPWQFVSPCNACRRGFVETAVLKKD
ncbi:MAG TPA: hypothetical protein VD701_03015 [Steroidobacteraceae bacterium]|nr:hypothetical protein [Steroidobacteraceae bacterium]